MEPNLNQVNVNQSQGNGLGVAALVLGIIGIVFFWVPFVNWISGVLAIIFGAVGVRKPVKKGVAKAGLILGIINIGLDILAITLLATFVASL